MKRVLDQVQQRGWVLEKVEGLEENTDNKAILIHFHQAYP